MVSLQHIIDAALPRWRREIGELRADCLDTSDLVALAVDGAHGVHTCVTTVPIARQLLDSSGDGLGAAILDDGACPPLPVAVVLQRAGGRVVAWSRCALDLGRPS